MLCCSRAENSSIVILKSNMCSMIYNVWSWYDVKITQNYLLVLFLINIYSQDYNYTFKYSYGHYMVFVMSVTIFFVLQFLFCLQLFIFWLCVFYIFKHENINLLTVFSRRLFYWLRTLQISDSLRDIFLDFEIQIN